MFDKHALNNQITGNIKSIKRAKILAISKLVKKCRKLKELEVKSSNDKIKAKIDKILQQISAVKKLNCLQTLKKAILFDKNPKRILTNEKASVQDIAEMLIFSNKIVVEIVQRLKVVFKLDMDTNPDWREEFQKTKKTKRGNAKDVPKKNEKSKSNPEKYSKNIEKPVVNPFKLNKIETKILNNYAPEKENNDYVPEKEKDNYATKEEKNEYVSEKEEKNVKNLKNKQSILKRKNRAHEIDLKEETCSNEKEFVSQPDLFFTTKSGQNYISTVCSENQREDEDDDSFNKYTTFTQINNSQNKSIMELNSDKKNFKNFNDYNIDVKYNLQDQIKNDNSDIKIKSNSDLHPSWQAKQKIKPIIHEFKGKKIKFDDL